MSQGSGARAAPLAATRVRGAAVLARRARDDPSSPLLLGQLVAAGAAFVVNLLAASALAPSGRGQLALTLQVAYLVTLLLLLGTDRSLVTTYAGAPARAGLAGARSLLRVPAGVAVALALVAALAPLPPLWRGALLAVAAFAVANAGLRALRSVAIASGRQRGYLLTVVVSQGALLAVTAGLFAAGVDQVLVWVTGYVLVTALPVAVCWRRWTRDDAAPLDAAPLDAATSGERRAAARREGMVLLPSSLALAGTLRLDRLLLAGLGSTASLGIYASVATMTELLAWPVQAWADSRLGRWRLDHQRGQLSVLRPIAAAAGFLVVGGVLLAAVVRGAVVPLLGEAYASAAQLVVPLVLAAGVFGLSQLVITALIAQGRARAASGVEVVAFAVSGVAYVALIPGLGGLGAAYGSLAGYGTALVGGLVALGTGRRGSGDRAVRARSLRAPSSRALLAPLLVLLVIAYGGRYGLERATPGADLPPWLTGLDLRVLVLPILVALVVHELGRRRAAPISATRGSRDGVPVREGWLVAALVFFLYQLGSALWAPEGSRVGAVALDVVATAVLTLSAYLLARGHGRQTGRATLWFLWVTACVYAVAALVAGPGDQGRFSAFGGGPNVFVRVEVLGLIALAGLLAIGAPRWLGASIPLLSVAAVLSGSRGGLVTGAVVAAVALVVLGRHARARAAAVALTAVTLVAGGAVAAALLFPPFADLVTERFVDQTLESGYTSQRPQIWAAAVALAAAQPLIGAGLDGFYGAVGRSLGVEYPHNVALAVLAEGGLVGAALLAVTVVGWVAATSARRPWGPVSSALVAAAGYVVVASAFSGDYYDARLAWCFAALAAGGLVGGGSDVALRRPAGAGAAVHASTRRAGP